MGEFKQFETSETNTQVEIHNIKDKLLDLLYWIFTIFMWFALAGSIFRTLDIGFRTFNYIQFLIAFAFLLAFLTRKKIPYIGRASILLVTIYSLGFTGLYSIGLLSTGVYFFLLFSILTGVLINKKWGIIAFCISLFTLIILGIAHLNNLVPQHSIIPNYAQSFSAWTMSIVIFSLVTWLIILFWQRILHFLVIKVETSQKHEETLNKVNKLLTKEIDSRNSAEYQLKNQIKETNLLNKKYEGINEQLKNSNAELERSNILLEEAKHRAQQADKLKSSFLSNMSHEIRTPMNAIVGFATLIANSEATNDDNRSYLKIIESSTNSLLNIINDILTLAKIESGQYTAYPRVINLTEITKRIEETYTREIHVLKENKIKFKVEQNFKLNTLIIADIDSVSQIINKLLDNAIKFTHSGFVKINISIVENCFLSILIEDSGIGIPSNIKSEIFETFRQVDLGNTKRYGGTGIGLSIVKGLVNLLNGTIEFSSQEAKGTSFNITFPVINKTPTSIGSKLNEITGIGKTILVIGKITWDDREINQIIQETNSILIYVETGFQAIDTHREHPEIDIVLVSLFLPDMSSHEVANILKSANPQLPVMAHVAANNEQIVSKHNWDYIIKTPLNKDEFTSKLNNFLK